MVHLGTGPVVSMVKQQIPMVWGYISDMVGISQKDQRFFWILLDFMVDEVGIGNMIFGTSHWDFLRWDGHGPSILS